jgi:hypothetical protein
MPWATLRAKPITEMEVIPDNGRKYVVTFHGGEAYLPLHLFNWMILTGTIDRLEKPDLKPQFEKLPGGVNGKPISPFSNYVREVER